MVTRCWLIILLTHGLYTTVNANDACTDAIPVTGFPFSTVGDTTNATVDFETPADLVNNRTCGISSDSRGVWYRITNPGEATLLKVTVSDAPSTSNNFIVALFRGETCDQLDCLTSGDFLLENQQTQPTLTWFVSEEESYYLHVTGTNSSQVGGFLLDIEEATSTVDRPANDQCVGATVPVLSVTDLEMEVGDTTGAFPHGIVNDACSVHPQSRGLFYQVIGTGDAMDVTLSITELAEDYRLELAVIESSCQTGECVASSDFLTADDETETITFQTQPDLVYYVAVTGERFEDVGKFEIVLTVSKSSLTIEASSSSQVVRKVQFLGFCVMVTLFLSFF